MLWLNDHAKCFDLCHWNEGKPFKAFKQQEWSGGSERMKSALWSSLRPQWGGPRLDVGRPTTRRCWLRLRDRERSMGARVVQQVQSLWLECVCVWGALKENRGIKVCAQFPASWIDVYYKSLTTLFKALISIKDLMDDRMDFSILLCFYLWAKTCWGWMTSWKLPSEPDSEFSPCVLYFFFLIFKLILEREGKGEQERETETETERNLMFSLSMPSLIASCICPDWRSNLQPWHML